MKIKKKKENKNECTRDGILEWISETNDIIVVTERSGKPAENWNIYKRRKVQLQR